MAPTHHDALRSHRRTMSLLGAALLAPFLVLERLAGASLIVSVAQAAWIASLLGAAALFRPGARVSSAWAEALMSLASTTGTVAVVWATGGVASGYFGFLFALPFCIAVLAPDAILWAGVSGLATTAAGAAMLVAADAASLDVARWTATGLGLGLLATIATHRSRALIAERIAAEQARAEMAERLAEQARRLAESQQLAIAGRLAAGVAHEVNNPLAYLKANLGWFRERLAELGVGGDSDVTEALRESELGVDRIARIMADLRDASRGTPEQTCRAPVAEVIAEARRVASLRTAGVAVTVDLAPGTPDARICRGRAVQILVNLLVNAADALAEAPGAGAWIEISAAPRDGGVALTVEDGGRGFPSDMLRRALDPFVTSKPPGHGMGLGLALAREYAGAAAGNVRVSNGPRGGAVVVVWLPGAGARDEGSCALCEYRAGVPAPLPPHGAVDLPRRSGW